MKIYIYIYIYITGMRKKNVSEKKTVQEHGMGYYPNFFLVESQYSKLYCDRLGRETAQGHAWTGQDLATTWPSLPAIWPRHGP